MELYFKDLEDEADTGAVGQYCESATADSPDDAEDAAFAELSERVFAARLVY